MRLIYIANARMPTEKAHGIAIARSCESFAKTGVETVLIVPRRRTPFQTDIFETYHVERNFSVRFLPTVDLIREKAGKFVFLLQAFTFYVSAFCKLAFSESRETILFSRDPVAVSLSRLGFRVVLECHLIPKNKKRFFTRAQRADRIIVISQALKKAFVEAGFPPESILVAPSGVDLSVFDIDISKEEARKKLDLPIGATIGVYTGNFTTMGEDKGISDIIKALQHAPEVVFVAAGGSDNDRDRYVKEASKMGVLGRVILRGHTPQKMLALYQKAADVLLMPFPDTPHYRNHMSPVKMFEYMVAKRPIIASDLPTIREVLSEQNSIIVPPGNPKKLAAALETTLQNHDGAQSLANQAYNDVASFSWTARTARVLAYISE